MKEIKSDMKESILSFLNGTMNTIEKANLLVWIKLSEDNKQKFLYYYHIWENDMKGQMNFDKTKGWKRFISNLENKQHKKPFIRRIKYYSVAIAACAAIAIVFLLYQKYNHTDIIDFANQTAFNIGNGNDVKLVLSQNKTLYFQTKSPAIKYGNQSISINNKQIISEEDASTYNQLIVPYGKRSQLILSDGTKVWVNAGTRLIYPTKFLKSKREVYVDGEIYLEVVHHDKWPFVVHTNDLKVNVLGTKFEISSYSSMSTEDVMLVSGSVRIDRGNSQTKLKPTYLYSLRGNNAIVYKVDSEQYISWINGVYTFKSEELNVIFRKLEKYYNVQIEYNTSVANLRCSGKLFLEQSFDKLMDGLSKTAPIIYREKGNQYIVSLKQ
jgi:hypothetical protein